MTADRFDVIVVGAGPAGSIAALLGARRGWRVALVDQRTFPRDKACGDGIGPGVGKLLRDIGLGGVLAGETPITSVTAYGPNGSQLNASLESVAEGYVVPRADFDQRLRLAALDAGAVDLSGHKAVGTGLSEDARWVDLQQKRISAPLVVAADGAYSVMRRTLGVGKPPNATVAIAMRAYAKSETFDPSGRMIFEWSRELLPAYGWIFPTGKGVVNVGVGVMLGVLRRRSMDLRRTLDTFAESCRRRGIDLGDLYAHRSHHLPLARPIPRLVHERAVLIGDAASMINPLSGEGIVYGMTAAARLIEAMPDLRAFEKWFNRTHRAHLLSCRIAHALMSSPWWARHMITAASRDPVVLRDAVDLLFGLGRIRADTTWRILRHGW